MRGWAVLTAVTLVCAALAVSAVATSAAPGAVDGERRHMIGEVNATNDTGFGVAVSSFVQSEAAQTEGAVEQGVWAAGTANVSQQAVDNRATALSDRIQRLREQRAALKAAYEDGNVTRVAYAARLAAINAQLQAISAAANDTREIGAAAGINTTAIGAVSEQARQAQGPPNGSGPPDDASPPDSAGSDSDSDSDSTGNDSSGQPDDSGPPDDRGNESNRGGGNDRTTTAGDG